MTTQRDPLTPDDFPTGRRGWLRMGLVLVLVFLTTSGSFAVTAASFWLRGWWPLAIASALGSLFMIVLAVDTLGTAWMNRR